MQKHIYDLRAQIDETEWRAKSRRNLVIDCWKKFGHKSENFTMLDVGCGSGWLQKDFETKFDCKTFGIDTSPQAVKHSKANGLKHNTFYSGKKIPFKDNSFDLVCSIDVLEHVKDDLYLLNEINRVMKRKSVFIGIVPARNELLSTRDKRLMHFRRYEKEHLQTIVSNSGLQKLSCRYIDFLLYFPLKLSCLLAKKAQDLPDIKLETGETNVIFNRLLYTWEKIENRISTNISLPLGVSLLIVAKK